MASTKCTLYMFFISAWCNAPRWTEVVLIHFTPVYLYLFIPFHCCRTWLQVPLQKLKRLLIQRSLSGYFNYLFYSSAYPQGVCCLRILDKWVLSSLLVSADNKKACSESRSCTQKPAAKEGEHQLLGNWNFSAVTFPSSWQLNNCQYAIGLYSAAWEQQAEACSDGTGHAASPFPGRLTTLYFAFWPLTEHVNQWNLKFWTPV